MALMRRKFTPKLVRSMQRNARKSRGPATAEGKQNVSLNAIKDGAYAKVELPHMRALGEDPAEYNALLKAMLASFQPRDAYEELLVTGIAKDYWRLGRVQRGEAAFLASRLHALQRDREWKAHLADRARLNAYRDYTYARKLKDIMAEKANPGSVHYTGLMPEGEVNSPDSPHKYAHILRTLRTIRERFLMEGFAAVSVEGLQIVLGDGANCLGSELITNLQSCSAGFDQQPAETQKYRRDHFLELLTDEIGYFEEEFRLYLGREVEVSTELAEAELLPSTENIDRIIRGETHLERLIEHKRQQLFEWRNQKTMAKALPVHVSPTNQHDRAQPAPWEVPLGPVAPMTHAGNGNRNGKEKPRQAGGKNAANLRDACKTNLLSV